MTTEVETSRATAYVRGWASGLNPSAVIRADYSGGAYIELTFGSEDSRPSEVINVWDYKTGQPEGEFHRWDSLSHTDKVPAITFEVQDWIRTLVEGGWHDWYEDYIRNA